MPDAEGGKDVHGSHMRACRRSNQRRSAEHHHTIEADRVWQPGQRTVDAGEEDRLGLDAAGLRRCSDGCLTRSIVSLR